MATHLAALRHAILAAVAAVPLTGCGEGSPDPGADSGATPRVPLAGLAPVPDGAYPDCFPSELSGGEECCVDVYCQPAALGLCVAAADVDVPELTGGLGAGSGSCVCTAVQGPHAPRPEDDGDCCYLVGTMGCDGRPLVVAGQRRRAPLRRGPSAWARGRA